MNTKYTWAWLIWLLAFGCIEYKAIKEDDGESTLTRHIWKLIGTNTPGRNWENWLARAGLVGFFIWLIPHFFTGAI
jgi:hypothetical protein